MFNLKIKNLAIAAGIALTAAVYAPVAINAAIAKPAAAPNIIPGLPEINGQPNQAGTCNGFAKRKDLPLNRVFLGKNADGETMCFYVDEIL